MLFLGEGASGANNATGRFRSETKDGNARH